MEGITDLQETVKTIASVADKIPDFTRETEYISLAHPAEYAFYNGDICSTDTGSVPIENYRSVTNEFVVPHSTSKHTKYNRSSYMVGALARWNNNYQQISDPISEVAKTLGLTPDCYNPYLNNVAQVVESVHCMEDAIAVIDRLLEIGPLDEKPNQSPTRYGQGIGSTEVPRGILFHDYEYDQRGDIIRANCVIPTGQNLENIDEDMKKLVPEIIDRPKKEITQHLEMLVRAYDPCISCSVHFLDVEFIEDSR